MTSPVDDDICRRTIAHYYSSGFAPTNITVRGLNPGETPSTTITYTRLMPDGSIETKRVVFE